jgi:hypothetical protein
MESAYTIDIKLCKCARMQKLLRCLITISDGKPAPAVTCKWMLTIRAAKIST